MSGPTLRCFPSVCLIGVLALAGCATPEAPTAVPEPEPVPTAELPPPPAAPVAVSNPDAGESARAKREEGKVGKRDAVKSDPLDRRIAETSKVLDALRESDLNNLFGAKGGQIGSGGLGSRGSGLGGGGTAEGLGGLGTSGAASVGGVSGYGVGGGYSGSVGGRLSVAPAAAPLSKDWVDYGHNTFEDVQQDFLSTFSIDVDTGAYTQSRRMLKANQLPPARAVRTEEFVNYQQYRYPQPERGQPFSITMEAAPHPWSPSHHVLRVGIQGARPTGTREPVHLTFLVDTSGSMNRSDKLPLAAQALHHLVDQLETGDTVALATYAGSTREVLRPTEISGRDAIHAAIDGLRSGGGTAMSSGMETAYRMARAAYVPGEENRVIVLSDGDANIGASSHESILKALKGHAKEGITLSTVGFGTGNYRDAMMEQLADNGDGNYSYIDSLDEAKRVFGEDLVANIQTIARDVKIQVAFDPDDVLAYRLIGYENRDIADEDFRNDAVDAGEVGAGHTVTALYDLVLRDALDGDIATVRVRHKPPGPDRPASEQKVGLPGSAIAPRFADGSQDLRLAWGSASFAEKLRDGSDMEEVDWSEIIAVVQGALRTGTERDDELLDLIRMASRLDRPAPVVEEPDALTVIGTLDPALIQEVLRRHGNQLQYCYQRELTRTPGIGGNLVAKVVIAKDGSVTSASIASSTLGNASVDSCVVGRFQRMQFPAPPSGIAVVYAPLAFSPELAVR